MQRKPRKAQRYGAPPFTFQPQTNELNPTPPDLTTARLRVRTPPMWVTPRQATAAALTQWPFANDYIYRLVLEIYVCMKRLLNDIKDGHFNLDVSLRRGADAPDPHYMAMRTDATKYGGKRYQVVNTDHKEDDMQHNFLLFQTMCDVMHFFSSHLGAYQSQVPPAQLILDGDITDKEFLKALY